MEFIDLQPDWDIGFYYKMDHGSLITEFDASQNAIYFLNKTATNQHFLQIAVPATFLAQYYRLTGKGSFFEESNRFIVLAEDLP